MRIFKMFLAIAAGAFLYSKVLLLTGLGMNRDIINEINSDPSGLSGLAFSIGAIIGVTIYLIPFVVAFIRQHHLQWNLLWILLVTPLVGGFFVGLLGAGQAGMTVLNMLIIPAVWVGALLA
ncbi:MAG: hypothetical protein IM620_08840, partial [Cytophagales bacterium]|nr:hypothetical protein [Cytophagales bacterium]